MRKTTLIVMLAGLAACSEKPVDTDRSLAELKTANAGYDAALVTGDAAALARYYTDDFRMIDDDANVRDKAQQIRVMTEEVTLLQARSDEVEVTPLGSDAALVTGRFVGSYRAGGKENAFSERYTSVWVRRGGEWKVKHEHASITPKEDDCTVAD